MSVGQIEGATNMAAIVPILYFASIVGAFIIGKRRGRWVAVPLAVALPFLGFLFALMLKKRCPHCREYMYASASVCPSCCRNVAG